MTCIDCQGLLCRRAYRRTTEVGAYSIADGSRRVLVCEACGRPNLTSGEIAGYELRAAATLLKELPRIGGVVFKFTRKALGLTQIDLARILGCAGETISRWENDKEPIQRDDQLALLGIVQSVLSDGTDPKDLIKDPGLTYPMAFEVTGAA